MEGAALKLSVPNPHVLAPEFSSTFFLFWLPFLVLTDLGVLFVDVVCSLVSSVKAFHD